MIIVGAGLSASGQPVDSDSDSQNWTSWFWSRDDQRHLGPLPLPGRALRLRHTASAIASGPGQPGVFASAEEIRSYIGSIAAEYGVKRHICFGCCVTSASWSSGSAAWTVEAQTNEGDTPLSASTAHRATVMPIRDD